MTRKHFQILADTIKNIPFTNEHDRTIVASNLADSLCSPSNPRFNKALFLKACGVNV